MNRRSKGQFRLAEHPHRRYNPLTDEWILVSPHREGRPWQGKVESLPPPQRPAYDPNCYLCPRSTRASGKKNPDYTGTFVFDNDFPALLPGSPPGGASGGGLLVSRSARGVCRVVCFSPRHDLSMADLEPAEILAVVKTWRREYSRLGRKPFIKNVQIFENKGEVMGCSNPHPHGQIWATEELPTEVAKENAALAAYGRKKRRCLLCDYLAAEENAGERVVCANDSFVALVPFWAVWPFETMVLPRRHAGSLAALTPAECRDLSDILKRLTIRYDNLFKTSFPYSMGFHQAPTDGGKHAWWHMHMHFYPPLLRSATVRKFMVGFEMLGEPQRDITPEHGAARLKALSETHDKSRE